MAIFTPQTWTKWAKKLWWNRCNYRVFLGEKISSIGHSSLQHPPQWFTSAHRGSPPPTRFYLVGQLTTPHIAALIHLSERRSQFLEKLWRALPVTMTWMLTVQVYSEHASHGWRWCASKYNVQSLSAKSSPICDASSCEICGGIYGYTLWLLASQRLWSTFTFNSTTSFPSRPLCSAWDDNFSGCHSESHRLTHVKYDQ